MSSEMQHSVITCYPNISAARRTGGGSRNRKVCIFHTTSTHTFLIG